jgi:hypothetical protein
MNKKMEPVEVYVSDSNFVCIKTDDYGGGEQIILLHPSQIDLLIEWLYEAKTEAMIAGKNE